MPPGLLVGVLAAYGVIVGIGLLRRRPDIIRHAKLYLAFSVATYFGLVLWAILTLEANAAGRLTGELLWGLVAVFLWIAYFNRSKRVALTYGAGALKSRPSRRLVATAFLAAILLVAAPSAALRAFWPSVDNSWVEFAPTGGGFSMFFPGEPAVTRSAETSGSESILVVKAVAEAATSGMAFALAYVDLVEAPAEANGVLDAMREGVAKDPEMRVGDVRAISIAEHPGSEFVGVTENLRIHVRLFLVGKRAYELRAVTPISPSASQLRAADRFLTSFELRAR
jgi:hypothetical protein